MESTYQISDGHTQNWHMTYYTLIFCRTLDTMTLNINTFPRPRQPTFCLYIRGSERSVCAGRCQWWCLCRGWDILYQDYIASRSLDTADTGILPDQNSNTLSMTINNCGHRKLNSLRTVCETMEHVVVVGRCR